jgi:putative FmdB family regulatory protein
MPLYDYQCSGCEQQSEVFHKLDEDPPDCDCGGKLEKVFRKANVIGFPQPTGPIYDWNQVHASHGKDWRRTTKTNRPGGDRKADYYDPKCQRRSKPYSG